MFTENYCIDDQDNAALWNTDNCKIVDYAPKYATSTSTDIDQVVLLTEQIH